MDLAEPMKLKSPPHKSRRHRDYFKVNTFVSKNVFVTRASVAREQRADQI